jgi:hypothetical protein
MKSVARVVAIVLLFAGLLLTPRLASPPPAAAAKASSAPAAACGSSPAPPTYTAAQKARFKNTAVNLMFLVMRLGALSNGKLPADWNTVMNGLLYKLLIRAAELVDAANDPADANYRVIPQPVFGKPKQLSAGGAVTVNAAFAYNNWQNANNRFQAYSNAMLTAVNRMQGALNAHDTLWARRQATAAAQYATEVSALSTTDVSLRAKLRSELALAGLNVKVTASGVRQAKTQLVRGGQLAAILRGQHVSQQVSNQIVKLATTVNAAAAVGSFPAVLSAPPLDTATQRSATAAKSFASAASCYAAPALPAAKPTATPAPRVFSNLHFYIDGTLASAYHDKALQVTAGTKITLRATWDGGSLDGTGWYVIILGGHYDLSAHRFQCNTGTECSTTDVFPTASIPNRDYHAELHRPDGNWTGSELGYVTWTS